MQQYFIEQSITVNDVFPFNQEQAKHIQKVMRMDEDSVVKVVDQNGQPFLVQIQYQNKEVFGKVVEALKRKEEKVKITLIQGMIKKEKWEFLIQKCCELGVHQIIPMISSRSIVKVDKDDHKKIERYNKIALEACEQCKRDTQVEVLAPILFRDINKYTKDVNIVAYESADVIANKLKDILEANKDCKHFLFVIGSEGGFSEDEIATLQAQSFICASLGERILRAETAAMSVVNITQYHLD